MDIVATYFRGLLLSASLFVSIGPQSAFVLRTGLTRRNVLVVVLMAGLCDALLTTAGVTGAGAFIATRPRLMAVIAWVGACYLVIIGVIATRRALSGTKGLAVDGAPLAGALQTLAIAAGFTLLNPQVYIDTLVVLGGMGARESGLTRIAFAAGAITASFAWFGMLGFGARLLAPLFAKPMAWRVLDGCVGVVVFATAVMLVR